jgi:glycolate oxidase FAD binding subunit
MPDVLSPRDEKEIADLVVGANRSKEPLAIVGGGTRAGLGRPTQTAATLTTARIAGVTLYQPAELVLSARAGTPLAEIDKLLAAKGQRLPFEPMDHRSLLGTSSEPTIGGIIAANVSGPRRIQAGAARDSLIGLRAVTGKGDIVKSGGRVMKNVTGYDLVKLLAGSYGTLAVLSEVTLKVLPAPETESTLIFSDLGDEAAVAALSAALGSPFSVTGAAHRPAFGREPARTFVRVEGFYASVVEDPAHLRPLRLLHRDLPDLCAARRRARQPARPHLPDQGHAGERPPGDAGGGQACRPLPLLPLLHDDLPLRRALHAPRRPCPRATSRRPISGRWPTG